MGVRGVPSPSDSPIADRLRSRIDDLIDERERLRAVNENLSADNERLREINERLRLRVQPRVGAQPTPPNRTRTRVYTRKFDWDEARRLRHDEGLTYPAIAERMGVSAQAVARVCDPAVNERMAARIAAYQASGTCAECGGPASRNYHVRQIRCRDCANAAKKTSVRPDNLWCGGCTSWKPDGDFPSHWSLEHRRGRSTRCRACHTEMKREWRRRHPATCVRCGGPATPDSNKGRPARVCATCYRLLRRLVPGPVRPMTVDELLAAERDAA